MRGLSKNFAVFRGRATHAAVVLLFLFSTVNISLPRAMASALPYMPEPNQRLMQSGRFNALLLRGIKVDPQNIFQVDFIVDEGNSQYSDGVLRQEIERLFKYFLASVTIPPSDLWVNLSPYEHDSIAPYTLGLTEMGKDLLGQDYCLKQLASSLTYPESALGKQFWNKVYQRAQELYGKADIPVNTFNKVWIVPGKIILCEDKTRVFIKSAKLKVMTEEDYLALKNNHGDKKASNLSAQVMKEVVIPAIETEVNEGKSFAYLRQIYNAMLLATWFKDKLRTTILGPAYVDQRKVKGAESSDALVKEKIYQQYLEAVRQGVYNYKRADFDFVHHRMVLRRYYSGGFSGKTIPNDLAAAEREAYSEAAVIGLLGGTGIDTRASISGIGQGGEIVRFDLDAATPPPVPKFVFGKGNGAGVLPFGSLVAFMDISRGSSLNMVFGRQITDKVFNFIIRFIVNALEERFGDRLVWPEGYPEKGTDEIKFAIKPAEGEVLGEAYCDRLTTWLQERLQAAGLKKHRALAGFTDEENSALSDALGTLPKIPAGFSLAREEISEAVVYEKHLKDAEMRQQVGKKRELEGAYAVYNVGPEAPIERPPTERHLISKDVRAQMADQHDRVVKEVAARLGPEFSVEGIGPSIAIDMLNGHKVTSEAFWNKLLAKAKEQREPSEFVVRRAPETFYLVRTFGWDEHAGEAGEAQVQVINISAFYKAAKQSTTEQDFRSVRLNSGRMDAGSPLDRRLFVGFKGPNDTFGHSFGTELIQLELFHILKNISALDREMTPTEIILALEQALGGINPQTIMEVFDPQALKKKSTGFEVYFEPGEVSTLDLPKADGATLFEMLEKLHRARHAVQLRRHVKDAIDPEETKLEVGDAILLRDKVMLKAFSDNKNSDGDNLAKNVVDEDTAAQAAIRTRIKKSIDLDSKRMAASLMMKKLLGKRFGFAKPFDEYLAGEKELLGRLTGKTLQSGRLEKIGQKPRGYDRPGQFNDLETIVALTQMAVMVHNVGEYMEQGVDSIYFNKIKSAADFVEKTHNILGFITEPLISRGPVTDEMQKTYARNRDHAHATAFLAQVLEDGKSQAIEDGVFSKSAGEAFNKIQDAGLKADAELAAKQIAIELRMIKEAQAGHPSEEPLDPNSRKLMGKNIQSAQIEKNKDSGKLELVVTDSLGEITKVDLKEIDVDMDAVFEALSYPMDPGGENVEVLALVKETLVSGELPDAYFFDLLVEDALGKGENAIALYKDLVDNPVAIFHEVLEYLQAQGRITLKFDREAGALGITDNRTGQNKTVKLSNDKEQFKLTAETPLDLAEKGAMPGADANHYNARALARAIFGEDDEATSLQVTAILKPPAVIPGRRPTTTGGVDLGAVSGQIEKSVAAFDVSGREIVFYLKDLEGITLKLGKVTIINPQK